MSQKQFVYQTLTDSNIPFEVIEHPAVFTIEEMQELHFPADVSVAKNLFLRDGKGKRHFLLVVKAEQKVNLKQLEQVFQCSKLSFASEERLEMYLGLSKGSVSPLGLLNDTELQVECYVDEKFCGVEKIGVHPNDNTATVFLSFEHLRKMIESTGHPVQQINLTE